MTQSELYQSWPDYAQDAYRERIAIMREANNIPDKAPTPPEIIQIAQAQAESEIALFKAFKDRISLHNSSNR